MGSALAIVNNPTQLLFAIEAAHFFNVPFESIQVVAVPTPGADDEQLYANLVAKSGIRGFRKLPESSLTRSGRVRDIRRLGALLGRNDLLFTSMLNYLPARALLHRAGPRAVVTDDGSWTVYVADRRRAGHRDLRRVHALFPFARLPKRMRFFTLYGDLTFAPDDIVARNTLTWSHATSSLGARGDHVVILGTALVTDGYLPEQEYRAALARLRELTPGPAEYWPHRREEAGQVARVCMDLGMELKERLLPLEAEILMAERTPKIVGTLPSTAATTLQLLKGAVGYEVVLALPNEEAVPPRLLEVYRTAVRSSVKAADRLV